MGVWVLAPERIFHDHAFRLLDNAPFLENVPLTEAKDHD